MSITQLYWLYVRRILKSRTSRLEWSIGLCWIQNSKHLQMLTIDISIRILQIVLMTMSQISPFLISWVLQLNGWFLTVVMSQIDRILWAVPRTSQIDFSEYWTAKPLGPMRCSFEWTCHFYEQFSVSRRLTSASHWTLYQIREFPNSSLLCHLGSKSNSLSGRWCETNINRWSNIFWNDWNLDKKWIISCYPLWWCTIVLQVLICLLLNA